MKLNSIILILAFNLPATAESELLKAYKKAHKSPELHTKQTLQNHQSGASEVSKEQDELAADVQELIQEETNEKVIQFLSEAESLMAQATDNLSKADTSGSTIAISTEIIEKIAAAAQAKSQSSSGESQNHPLLEMMQQMLGNSPSQEQKLGDAPGPNSGEGSTGDSDRLNDQHNSESSGKTESRTVPKNSGKSGTALPREFHKALDAFNKAQDQQK